MNEFKFHFVLSTSKKNHPFRDLKKLLTNHMILLYHDSLHSRFLFFQGCYPFVWQWQGWSYDGVMYIVCGNGSMLSLILS